MYTFLGLHTNSYNYGDIILFYDWSTDSNKLNFSDITSKLRAVTTSAVVLHVILRGGADKSLARPGRKQTTANKLRVYSTYSPRSSIHFLARCSNFCKPLKKNQKVVRPTRSPRQQRPQGRKKNGDLSIVFSVQGTGGSPTGTDPENRVGDQDIGSPR